MVLVKLQDSGMNQLNNYLTAQKQKIIKYFENLWEKYGIDVILSKGKKLDIDKPITKPVPKSKDKRKALEDILKTYKESDGAFYSLDDAVNEILTLLRY
jgi:hypothetical protein